MPDSSPAEPTPTPLAGLFRAHVDAVRAAAWEGSFEEYLDVVRETPSVAQLSHARVYEMIKRAGVSYHEDNETHNGLLPPGHPHYAFFEEEVFGSQQAIEQIVTYYRSAAARLEPRKRILLLMGPPGGGKSTIVALLKKQLEAYALTDEGAAYTIQYPPEAGDLAGRLCPQQEEPLHAVPTELRSEVAAAIGTYMEGELCPLCRYVVEDVLGGDFTRLRVTRVLLSEQGRKGVGTYHPHDRKSMQIEDLVGSINLSTIGEFGMESDPRAYAFDGEFNIANRGILEMVEILKAPPEFLYLLLTLTQEQAIKAGRFPMIYADESIIGHTNQSEYDRWLVDAQAAALRDRTIVVRVPYNLRLSDEVRIYEKLLSSTDLLSQGVHLDPKALEVAATFAVLTRLADSKKAGVDRMRKLRLYNGEEVTGMRSKDVKELQEESTNSDEGMRGISPRFVIDALSSGVVRDGEHGASQCLTAIETLRSLRDALALHPAISASEREEYLQFISEARKAYDTTARIEVQKAFVHSFEDQAESLLNKYLDNVEAFCNSEKVHDPLTDEELEADEALMRSIEEQIAVGDATSKSFREEILVKIGSYARSGKSFTWSSHPRLREAIEGKLFSDMKDLIRVTVSTTHPDPEQLARLNAVAATLMDSGGYCATCANELLRYTGTMLAKG